MPASPVSATATLALYRHALRTVRTFPIIKLRPKLQYNVRHAFELYRDVSAADAARLHDQARFDLQVLEALGQLPDEHLHRMFRDAEVNRVFKHGLKGRAD
ncbi:hypothetical protein GGF32_008191 [Allomyces javanicus]|nr:hypothetical protein GGF32_008191 [Allomyces javanicus]